jgi:hypothetical protein
VTSTRSIPHCLLATIAIALLSTAFARAQSTETVIHSFAGTDGGYPVGNLISDAAGNLYGATYVGRLQNATGCNPDSPGFQSYCGTIFKLSKTSGGDGLQLCYTSLQAGPMAEIPRLGWCSTRLETYTAPPNLVAVACRPSAAELFSSSRRQ